MDLIEVYYLFTTNDSSLFCDSFIFFIICVFMSVLR